MSDTIDRACLSIFSSLSFLLGWLLRSIGSLVRDTSEPYLATSPLSFLSTLHTSLPLVGGGSWRRPTPSGPSPTRFYTKLHLTPTSEHTHLFVCFVFPQTTEKTQDVYKAASIDFLSRESLHCISWFLMATYVITIRKELSFSVAAELWCCSVWPAWLEGYQYCRVQTFSV
jgi:hypothetical protein